MQVIKQITERNLNYEFIPPLQIPDEIPVMNVAQVLGVHVAKERCAFTIAGLLAEQIQTFIDISESDMLSSGLTRMVSSTNAPQHVNVNRQE